MPTGDYDGVNLALDRAEAETFRWVRDRDDLGSESIAYGVDVQHTSYSDHRLVTLELTVPPAHRFSVCRAINRILRDVDGFRANIPALKDGWCNEQTFQDLNAKETIDAAIEDVKVFGDTVTVAERIGRVRAVSDDEAVRCLAEHLDPRRALVEIHLE